MLKTSRVKQRALRAIAFLAVLVTLLVRPCPGQAQPLDWADTPPDLKPWIPWVLDGLGDQVCPVVGEHPVCVWPGLMQLDLDGTLGHFRLTVVVDRKAIVDLPGAAQSWPQNVEVNGSIALVLDRDGVPGLSLGKGTHIIEGDYVWNALPETLRVPEHVGLIALRRDGEVVQFPKRDPQLLWLRASGVSSDEPQRLSLEVFRHLHDGVPFKVTTRLALRVGGKAREVNLGKVSLAGGSILKIASALPVRLNEDETLSVQVYAGSHSIDVEALFATPPGKLQPGAHEDPWPQIETWVLAPDPNLRQVQVTGASPIDPSRTNLPQEWQQLGAYSVDKASTVDLVTSRRGEPDSPPNRLRLQRDIWLDLDADAYTVRDRITGQMNRDWRLDLNVGELGRVLLDGEPQLITNNPSTTRAGVELRKGQLSLVAEWRTKAVGREFPAVGWSQDVQELGATLHVPPGWELINATGVDGLSQTWWSSWDLFSIFFVLIVSIAIAQLTHASWGMLALLTLVLTHDQTDAPRFLWAVLLTAIALLRVLPKGWLRKVVSSATVLTGIALMIVLVDYTASEVRTTIYPQTAAEGVTPAFGAAHDVPPSAPTPYLEADESERAEVSSSGGRKAKSVADQEQKQAPAAPRVQRQQDPQAVVQTGPGIPEWTWRNWSLNWSGPVHRDHKVRFLLLPRAGGAMISVLRILLGGVLALLLLRFAAFQLRNAPLPRRRSNPAPAALLLGAVSWLGAMSYTDSARAEIPSQEMLDQLRERVTRSPLCAPHCSSVQRMDLTIAGDQLAVTSEVHVATDGSFQLPGPFESWAPGEVRINGTPAAGMMLSDDGFLHLRLPPGRYWVAVKGPVVGHNLTLTLGARPRSVRVTADGWDVDGVNESGSVEGSLRFHKRARPTEPDTTTTRLSLPSWLLITRTFQFGANWSISTHVERVGPAGSPIVERFRLLPTEQVTRADVVVENGEAVLSLGLDQTALDFDSVLDESEKITLVAQKRPHLSERWVVQCGPIWSCTTAGIAPDQHQNEGHWEPRFTPWPGDEVEVALVRPEPAGGESLTIDQALLDVHPGTRLLKATLTADLRSSSRNLLEVGIPEAAEVQELLLDGKPHALQNTQGSVELSIDPGQHDLQLSWQEPSTKSLVFVVPKVKLSVEGTNVRVNVHVPEDRWLLGVLRGPTWGPAILLWGYVLFIIVVAVFVLGRIPDTPLTYWQWILLGLGLTQVPAPVAVLIASWFFVIAYAPRWRPKSAVWYNLTQAALVWFTLVFLVCLFAAVYQGLLNTPDMQVAGAGSTNRILAWYVDRTESELPRPWVITTSLWVWRLSILAWSLWLAFNLLGWLKWGFRVFSKEGLWRAMPKRVAAQPAAGYDPGTAPASYPGAQWVETSSSNPPPRSSSRPSSRPTPTSATAVALDSGPTTLPTGAAAGGRGPSDDETTLPTGVAASTLQRGAARRVTVTGPAEPTDSEAPPRSTGAPASDDVGAASVPAPSNDSPSEAPPTSGSSTSGPDAEDDSDNEASRVEDDSQPSSKPSKPPSDD